MHAQSAEYRVRLTESAYLPGGRAEVDAITAAEEVGTEAVTAVRGLVGTTIRGVKVPEPKQLPKA